MLAKEEEEEGTDRCVHIVYMWRNIASNTIYFHPLWEEEQQQNRRFTTTMKIGFHKYITDLIEK